MSSLTLGPLSSTVAGQVTSTLVPTVTRVDARDDSFSIVIVFSIVFILAPVTISGNTMILAAFYRYKRLRTASNCLLASLALSDLGVGVFMPFGIHLELSGIPETGISSISTIPYCIGIALCSVSVLISVAIAVDRLTSLAQPLRYKNIITHSSVEKYIAVFWIYAIGVGLSPLVYSKIMGFTQPNSEACQFGAAIQPPVRVFLVIAVWAPSALILLGCYIYVYLVARAHARAIYTVELSFRHQTQTLALPRYGQTLAVTVGAFLILWLPFQTCMLLDIFCDTKILTSWSVVWLGLPILAHSGINPWIYAFHHGGMRVAAGKIAEDIIILFGIRPSRYGCSPLGRGGSNLELAEVNNKSNNGEHRPPVEDCFAAKHHNNFYSREKRPEIRSHTDISPEDNNLDPRISHGSEFVADIVEENVDDLSKMLERDYIYHRCHVIDTNHNVDKIKNFKYLLDPTFNKIRHLRRLNQKRVSSCERKKCLRHHDEPKFISYQNLMSDSNGRSLKLNALSDPMLNVEITPYNGSTDINEVLQNEALRLSQRRDSGLASVSDPNIKALNVSKSSKNHKATLRYAESHGHSVLSLNYVQCLPSSGKPDKKASRDHGGKTRSEIAAKWKHASKQLTVTANRLSSLFHLEPNRPNNLRYSGSNIAMCPTIQAIPNSSDNLRHLESIGGLEKSTTSRLLEPVQLMDSLTVPTIRSEPPSPIDPCPLGSLREEEDSSEELSEICQSHLYRSRAKSPVRHSDPVPYVLNIEDFDREINLNQKHSIDPKELTEALTRTSEKREETRTLSQNLFPEHNSTRFNSRRPSDLRWSEASRSQEILSSVNRKHQRSPSSYSVNNFQGCNSSSDFNDITCLDSFICPDALTSSLRESFFQTPSIQDSDTFTSFDEPDTNELSFDSQYLVLPGVHSSSVSSVDTKNPNEQIVNQSKSTDSLKNNCRHAVLQIQSVKRRDKFRVGLHSKNAVIKDSKGKLRSVQLAKSTSIDISTPSFEPKVEIKGTPGIGVRV